MLRNISNILRYKIGFHTDHIQVLMKNFSPDNQNSCIDILQQIQKKKQYIGLSQVAQGFVNKVEYTVLHRQKFISSRTLYLYQLLKKLQLLSGSFKYQIYKKLQKQLQGILQYDLNVKNTELESLLWFMYRQYPFLRNSRTLQIASQHSLKLFEILQFMNNQKKIPRWDPYLRIVSLLRDLLGHDIQVRTDITRQEIQNLPYLYLPFVRHIFHNDQICQKFQQQYHTYTPFYQYLTQLYIDKDKYVHDAYLQYVEVIDNEKQGQEIERYYGTLQWSNFAQFFSLYCQQYDFVGLNQQLVYKVDQLFWRVCETSNVGLQPAISILKDISTRTGVMDKYQGNMFNRSIDAIKDTSVAELRYLPGQALFQMLRAVNLMKRVDVDVKKQTFKFCENILKTTKNWDIQGKDKQSLQQIFNQNTIKYRPSQQTKKILQMIN